MEEKKYVCECCGEEVPQEELFINDNNYCLCNSCYESEYFTCEDCGRIERIDYSYHIEDIDKYVCENCSCNYYYCEKCGEYVENATYIQDEDIYICESCYDSSQYFYCDGCGRFYSYDSYACTEDYDYYYCTECREPNPLMSYHSFNDWQEYYGSKENPSEVKYLIGDEKEFEPKGSADLQEVINIMNNNINDIAMEDSSLAFGGCEIISHPRSWEYLKEHKEDYRNFYNQMEDIGYGNNGGCGLHFHITKPNENVISRILVIMESFKSEIKKLSRRREHQLTQWAKFLTDYNNTNTIKYQSSKYLKEKFLSQYHDRYMALNLTNSKTIEFRFFNGANNFEEYWASLQFIHNLMQLALNEDLDLNHIKWDYLIYGEELIAQAIKTKTYLVDKYAKDTTDIYEKVLQIEETTKNDLKKVMNNFIKYVNRELSNIELGNSFDNYNELVEKTNNYSDTIYKTCNYIKSLVRITECLDTRTINDFKWSLDLQTNKEKYKRYFNKLHKLINNYESEVAMQCA